MYLTSYARTASTIGLLVVLLVQSGGKTRASTIFTSSGLSSAGVAVAFRAELTISGDNLTVVLTNESPVNTLNPADTLGSFYWDIVNGSNVRPTLTYVSATGDVYLGNKNNPDSLQTVGANLKATAANDNTWQFKVMNAALSPFGGFGIGTVGNNSATPNNFNGNIVGAIEYSIYKGEITTNNLDGKLLVKETASFNFTGLTGFTEADIRSAGAFGLGTAPDSFINTTIVPEPSSALLSVVGLTSIAAYRRRGRRIG
jgi:hypothetical protein